MGIVFMKVIHGYVNEITDCRVLQIIVVISESTGLRK